MVRSLVDWKDHEQEQRRTRMTNQSDRLTVDELEHAQAEMELRSRKAEINLENLSKSQVGHNRLNY
jgi:hypothetical protein